jgi:DNA-damage-inducible protein D
MKKELIVELHRSFEDRARKDGEVEFWLARDVQELLGYAEWRNFTLVIEKARTACTNAGVPAADHFVEVNKMIDLGKGAQREVGDHALTRYACYLIAQNGDPKKDAVAFAMTYFAVQTRRAEIIEQRLTEWERVRAREKLTTSEKELSGLIYERGVDEKGFGRIRSKGDSALFGGYSTQGMKDKLGVPPGRALADFLPTITIKAKDFANEITNVQVRQQNLRGEDAVTREHVKNNKDVRGILTSRSIVPENLPPDEDVKKIERRLKSDEKKLPKQAPRLAKPGRGPEK